MKEYRVPPGETIYFASLNAIKHAISLGEDVEFEHNGIRVQATPGSNPIDIATIVSLKQEIRRLNLQHGIK